MDEQNKLEQAKVTFATLCEAMDNNNWHYDKNEEKLFISSGVQGDDLPIEFTIEVNADRWLVLLLSRIPLVVQEDKRLDVAIAVSAINNMLIDGCFDYDVSTGRMFFRMTNSYLESKMGADVFTYMLFAACHIIDEYNDKFLMLAKGIISIEQFLSSLQN